MIMMGKKKIVSIVIPTWNEAKIVKKTLQSYLKLALRYPKEIIVVDDNSSDGTIEIVKELSKNNKNLRLIVRKNKSGFGSALSDGTKAAKGDYIIWTMADGCDQLSIIPKMFSKLDKGYDVVVASRNARGGNRGNQPILKSVCSWGFCKITNLFFGVGIKDSTNAFRAFRKGVMKKITLDANDFSISPEMILKARRAGFRIGEIPVKYKERSAGQTKFKLFKMGRSFLKVLLEDIKQR